MAIAGGGIPSMPIKLVGGKVSSLSFTTNKPASLVEQDIDNAVRRLLAGERFEMHCSGSQIYQLQQKVNEVLNGLE